MSMRQYVGRRIIQLAVTFFVFLSILFVIFRLAPGDPGAMYLMDGMSAADRERAIAERGLDQPMYRQYFDYLIQLTTLDLGTSYRYNTPVAEVVWIKFWNTIFLMGTAFVLAYTIGIVFGSYLGWIRGTVKERAGIIITLVARSSPEFWIGILMLMVFSNWLGLFPTGGMRPPGLQFDHFYQRYLNRHFVYHLVLPVLTGVIFYMATPTLLMRSSMINILNSDFIEIKKATGLPTYVIMYKHAARNSILPVTTVMAIVVGVALGGSLIIETVFNWPGMGREMVDSIEHNDYPVAQAVFFLMGSTVIVMNFVADLLYVYLDPRVTYE